MGQTTSKPGRIKVFRKERNSIVVDKEITKGQIETEIQNKTQGYTSLAQYKLNNRKKTKGDLN